MSVLLRQPHGFEGLGAVTVFPRLGDLPTSQRKNVELVLFEGNATGPSATGEVNADDDSVAGVDELLWLHLKLSELEDLREVLHAGIAAAMRSAPERIVRSVPPHRVRIRQLDHGLEIAPIERVQAAAHKLNVLLRHRPRSIAPTSVPA